MPFGGLLGGVGLGLGCFFRLTGTSVLGVLVPFKLTSRLKVLLIEGRLKPKRSKNDF